CQQNSDWPQYSV
nr:immunoglobulin light chain junction region [Macaca mulatta]